jgi:glycosyltransferase involved in cell wall biosynthesis
VTKRPHANERVTVSTMKLIVQIPCHNEEQTLPAVIKDIPREIEGIDRVEILVIDDGSTDRTVEVARELGVDHILINKDNLGLASSFRRGIDASLSLGADIIVNTDGDNQYAGWDIPTLIKPVLDNSADIVVGDRGTGSIGHFSATKRFLQRFGSYVVQLSSNLDIPDAVSGFRAISRDAAFRLNIVSPFSYATEMLIQAGRKHMSVASVPVATNPKARESRLFSSLPRFIERHVTTIVRTYAMYQPMRVFSTIGAVFLITGMIPVLRFLFIFFTEGIAGHIQSLVLGGALLSMGFISLLVAFVAELISFNRQLLEITLEKVRRLEQKEALLSRDYQDR